MHFENKEGHECIVTSDQNISLQRGIFSEFVTVNVFRRARAQFIQIVQTLLKNLLAQRGKKGTVRMQSLQARAARRREANRASTRALARFSGCVN